MAELIETELDRRLNLYQTFVKLYEHHSDLLDNILQLENLQIPSLTKTKSFYFQGVIDSTSVYATTNLCAGETQTLQQPQQIWTIGRSCHNGIRLADSYVSRRHAAVQFVEEEQSFYLIDFNSTNGSYLNGEPAFKPVLLKDGDRIRLGNTSFYFFFNANNRTLPSVAVELLMQMMVHPDMDMQIKPNRTTKTRILRENLDDTVEIPNGVSSQFQLLEQESNVTNVPVLDIKLSSEILSYFSNKPLSSKLTPR
jgi:pSer/pThr/pTyr-binding forkhead associated (FHA) protein